MKLTRVERWILANQYKILDRLDPDSAEYYAESREALESGYEREYERLAETVYAEKHTLSEADCGEVWDILLMYQNLKESHQALRDGGGVEKGLVQFPGFDGHNETSQLGYCRYICEPRHRRFEGLNRGDDFNSHMPTLDGYRRMLEVWRRIRSRKHGHPLTKEELVAVVSAWPHPESEMGKALRKPGRKH